MCIIIYNVLCFIYAYIYIYMYVFSQQQLDTNLKSVKHKALFLSGTLFNKNEKQTHTCECVTSNVAILLLYSARVAKLSVKTCLYVFKHVHLKGIYTLDVKTHEVLKKKTFINLTEVFKLLCILNLVLSQLER